LPKRSNTGVVCPAIPDPDAANPWVTRHASLVQSLQQAQKRRPSSAIFLADGRSPESAIVPSRRQVRRPVLTPATAGFLRRRPFVSLLFRARLASAPRDLKCRFNRALRDKGHNACNTNAVACVKAAHGTNSEWYLCCRVCFSGLFGLGLCDRIWFRTNVT
jgi:hypothetical protein